MVDIDVVVDIDERVNIVERVITLIDRIWIGLLDRPNEAQMMSNPIFTRCIEILTEPVRVTNGYIKAGDLA